MTCQSSHSRGEGGKGAGRGLYLVLFPPKARPACLHVGKCELLSHARLFATPWTAAHQAPLSMRFSRQGYWSGLPFPSPGDLPDPGIKPGSPALAGRFFTDSYKESPFACGAGKYLVFCSWKGGSLAHTRQQGPDCPCSARGAPRPS